MADIHHTPALREEAAPPIPVRLGLFLALLFTSSFYLTYPHSAWFLQDDFQLIMQYAHALQPQQILDFGGFGRFLSRNVYWHYGIKLFTLHAPLFYVLNLFFICATSFLVYRVVLGLHGRLAAIVAGLLYWCLPGTVESYAWLSNSQHLLGHLFVMVFVYLFTTRDHGRNGRAAALLLLVLALGLFANAFVGMVLSLPVWMLVASKRQRTSRWGYAVPVLGTALFLYVYLRLADLQTGVYATSFSPGMFWENARFYFKGDVGASLWIAGVLGGTAWAWRRGRLVCAWFFIASIAFLLPFAFLQHQRYGSYSVLTHLFFLLGCWSLACDVLANRRSGLVPYVGVTLVSLVLVQSLMLPIQYFSQYPSGKTVRQQVEQLRQFDSQHPAVKNYCFRSEKPASNPQGGQVWDVPAEWWQAGFGAAFSLFVNGAKTYELVSATSRCDATLVFRNQRLEPVAE